MGILNVTPDSFSDGGKFVSTEAAVEHGLKVIAEGADILDIGGESTRPHSVPVPLDEELRRVLPVIEKLVGRISVPISIDTTKPEVAHAALERGASIVNDIGANRADESMWRLVAEAGAGYVCMHMQGVPESMQQNPFYGSVTAEVGQFFGEKLSRLQACGVKAEQVALDVGIGFGKTAEHNLELLQNLRSFTKWKRPLVLGVSRKSFISKLTLVDGADRLPGSLACACWAAQNGVQIIRAHDVAATRQAVRMTELLAKI